DDRGRGRGGVGAQPALPAAGARADGRGLAAQRRAARSRRDRGRDDPLRRDPEERRRGALLHDRAGARPGMKAAADGVSRGRLWSDLMARAEVGATAEGGSRRLALTDEDRAGRDLFASWATDAGLELRADTAGNLFARRNGRDSGRPAVMTG